MGYFESFIGVNFWTALFVLLNTIALFLVMKKFLFAPVLKMIADRQAEIDGMYQDAASTQEQANAMKNDYSQKLELANETSQRIVQEAVVRGQNREEEIIRDARSQASAIMDKARADIAQEKKKALNDAKDEISGMAMAIAEKVVGRSLAEADQQRLVEQFIEELGEDL